MDQFLRENREIRATPKIPIPSFLAPGFLLSFLRALDALNEGAIGMSMEFWPSPLEFGHGLAYGIRHGFSALLHTEIICRFDHYPYDHEWRRVSALLLFILLAIGINKN